MNLILPGIEQLHRVVIRTNGGHGIGLGHYRRCAALGLALKKAYECELIWLGNTEDWSTNVADRVIYLPENRFDVEELRTINKLQPDLTIVDSYEPDFRWLMTLNQVSRTMLFDDNMRFEKMPANYVINGNIFARDLPYEGAFRDTRFLLGRKYLFLSPEYMNVKSMDPVPNRVLVTTGSGDERDLLPRLINWLGEIHGWTYQIVIGPYCENWHLIKKSTKEDPRFDYVLTPKTLRDEIQKSRLILCASGTTAYEAMVIGRPMILFQTAENQTLLGHALEKRSLAYNLGDCRRLTGDMLQAAFLFWQRKIRGDK